MFDLEILEYPIILQCNLACDNCNSFSNIGIKGKRTTIEEFTTDLDNWKNLINPKRFSILGGEPLLHKDVGNMIIKTRQAFPNTLITLVTNGLLLKYNKSLLKIIQDTNCKLIISVHSKENSYIKELYNNIEEFFNYDKPKNKLIKSNISFGKLFIISGVTVELRTMINNWTRLYKEGIKPYKDNPEEAHKVCRWAKCTQLYRGNLWKCSSVSFLKELIDRIDNKEDWIPYLNMYQPLNYNDTEEIKNQWFNTYLKPENVCSMCPSSLEKIPNKSINMRIN